MATVPWKFAASHSSRITKIPKALILSVEITCSSAVITRYLYFLLRCAAPYLPIGTQRSTHSFAYTCTYMNQHLHVQGYVWVLVSTTLSCSSLPLCLRAGAVQCTEWIFRFPLNPPQPDGHNTVAGKLWDKEKKITDKGEETMHQVLRHS